MGRISPLGLGLVLVFGPFAADAAVRMSQSHSLNGDVGPSHSAEAENHLQFGSGRGNLRPGLDSPPFSDDELIGSTLDGSIEIGALRFSGEAAANPFIFDLPARNFASAALEASFEESLTFGGVPLNTSLRVSYSYFTRGSLSASCSGESTERVTCASTFWERRCEFRFRPTDSC